MYTSSHLHYFKFLTIGLKYMALSQIEKTYFHQREKQRIFFGCSGHPVVWFYPRIKLLFCSSRGTLQFLLDYVGNKRQLMVWQINTREKKAWSRYLQSFHVKECCLLSNAFIIVIKSLYSYIMLHYEIVNLIFNASRKSWTLQ